MKIKNLLFATMLCGAFGIFTACSNDEDPAITPDPDNGTETEEVNAILALSGGLDDGKMQTRSTSMLRDGENSASDPEVTSISSLAVAVFEVTDDKLGKLLIFEEKEADKGEITPDNFDLPLLKFKVNKVVSETFAKVGIVVLANYDFFLNEENRVKFAKIGTYTEFKTFFDKNMFTSFGHNYRYSDQTQFPSMNNTYPMSSNVFICNVIPGKLNYIGYQNKNSVKTVVNTNANSGILGSDKDNAANDDFYSEINANPIPLFRGAAEVELCNLKFEDYGDQKFERFVLENVYIANIPTVVNWFGESTEEYGNGFVKWGGSLNPANYISDNVKFQLPFSGAPNDKKELLNFIAGLLDEGSGAYRSTAIAEKTTQLFWFDFQHVGKNIRLNSKESEFEGENGYKYGAFQNNQLGNSFSMQDESTTGLKAVKFAVSPSNYGSAEHKDQAMVLIVKGRYFYKTGNGAIVGPGKEEASRYWTVIINENGEVQSGTGLSANDNIKYEVKRNVRYEISLTINGPGSKGPWDKDPNTYVQSKVRIVPFGVVSQSSTID